MGKSEEEFRQSYNKTAEQQVREGLVLAEIANVEKLEATNQESEYGSLQHGAPV